MREYKRPEPMLDVLEEHLEEAAFQYNCRCGCLSDPELSWEDLKDFERRMYPHLHGLVLGGASSVKLLKPKLTLEEDEDPGEVFVASVVYTMLDLIEPMQWLIEALCQDPAHKNAIIDGLKYSNGRKLEGWLEYFIGQEDPTIRRVGIEVTGYRRITHLQQKLEVLQENPDPSISMAAIYALAKMGIKPSEQKVIPFLNNQDPELFLRAVELLLRMGSQETLRICRERCKTSGPDINRKLVFYLAIAGSRYDYQMINEILEKQPDIQKECYLALGLCGYSNAVDRLIEHLDKTENLEIYMAAYQGLRLLTGMDFLPEFDPDDAEPEEIIEYHNLWKKWWIENRNEFSNDIKWRRGEKLSPMSLYKDLIWSGNPCRDFTYLEMVIRYGLTIDFQYAQLYEIQSRQTEKIREWAQTEDNKYQAGACYYNKNKIY